MLGKRPAQIEAADLLKETLQKEEGIDIPASKDNDGNYTTPPKPTKQESEQDRKARKKL